MRKHEVDVQRPNGDAVNTMRLLGEDVTQSGSHFHEQMSSDEGTGDRGCKTGESDIQETSEDAKSNTSSVDSWSDGPPLNLNYEALKHVVGHFLPGSHGTCVDIATIRRGGFHEIRVLHFADGWSCIARFTRKYEMLQKTESELATMEYVRKNTTIPVPEIYFVNNNENHVVGAAFVLMELMAGEQLRFVWHGLAFEHKLGLVSQLANIVGQLADQKFDRIGSLRADGTLGPLFHQNDDNAPMSDNAFRSAMDWFFAFLNDNDLERTEAARTLYPDIKEELRFFFEKNADNLALNAPFGLLHSDFDYQNMLVVHQDKNSAPTISAIIDWDWSHTAPLMSVLEYPTFITDVDFREEEYADNKKVRKHFVACLIQRFPDDSPERKLVKQCFREKSYIFRVFCRILMRQWDDDCELGIVSSYLDNIHGLGDEMDRQPYGGRWDWTMDSDLEDSDADSEGHEETSEDSDGGLEHDSEGDSDDESDDEVRDDAETHPEVN